MDKITKWTYVATFAVISILFFGFLVLDNPYLNLVFGGLSALSNPIMLYLLMGGGKNGKS